MDKKVVALATADLHFHDWKQYNKDHERTDITSKFLIYLASIAQSINVPILVSGDWFHTPKGLTTSTIYLFMELMNRIRTHFPNVEFISITGNHEVDQGFSLVKAMELIFPHTIKCIDNTGVVRENFSVVGIPYAKRNRGLIEQIEKMSEWAGDKILLLHTELYGAADPSGYEPEPQNLPRNLNALFKAFNLVLAGHVHKYTPISKKVVMVGAPNQQRKSDAGCEMGYLEIYGDFSYKFIPYEAPGFKFYKEGDEHPNTFDFWIPIPKPRKLEKQSDVTFKPTMNRVLLAKKYAKATGVKNRRKVKTLIEILQETEND